MNAVPPGVASGLKLQSARTGSDRFITGQHSCFSVVFSSAKPRTRTGAPCWDSCEGYFSQCLCLEKAYRLTPQTTRSTTGHHGLRFPTKSVAEKLGNFPILRNFSSYSDNFPKLTAVSLSLACQRGERRARQHTQLLATRKLGY